MQVNIPIITSATAPQFNATTRISVTDTGKWNILIWIIIGTGIFLRVFHFFYNRSLWTDEIFLANSLIRMDFFELATQPLEYQQKAPIGFLWMVRLCVIIFGNQEMALRLFSTICGIVTLLLFLPVARFFLKPLGVAVSMGILAMAGPLVFHAVEVKQYSVELLATVIALYLYIRYHNKTDYRSLLLWGIWGALVVWFSYPSIFILAGIAFAVCLSYLINRSWSSLLRSIFPFSLWLISFAINYFLFTYKHLGPNSDWLLHWFKVRGAFMPLPPSSLSDLLWFFHTAYMTMRFTLGLLWIYFTHDNQLIQLVIRMPWLPLIIGGAGLISFYRQSRQFLMVLIFPCLLALFASALEIFPFYERLTVFLAPTFIILIARGCEKIMALIPTNSRWKYALPVILLAGPFMNSIIQLANPKLFGEHKFSEQRESFIYINDRLQQDDVVYVFWNDLHAYRYYKEAYSLKYDIIQGNDVKYVSSNINEYQANLENEIYQKNCPETKEYG